MNKDEIIKILKDLLPLGEETIADSVWYGTDLYEEAAERIAALSQRGEASPTWYKPEEKLPDDREPRICLMRSLEITHKRYYKLTHLNPGKTDFYVTYDDEGKAPIEKVVCWTDIPALPKPPQ